MNLDVSTDSGMTYVYDNINDKITSETKNPLVMAVLISIMLVYFLLFNVLGKQTNVIEKSGSTKIIELFAWAILLILIFII